MNEPSLCPICERAPTYRTGPYQWECASSRCNSQFYVDEGGLLAVKDLNNRERRSGCGSTMTLYLIVLCAIIWTIKLLT